MSGLFVLAERLGIRINHSSSFHLGIWVEEVLCHNHLAYDLASCVQAWRVHWGPVEPIVSKYFRLNGTIEYPTASRALTSCLTSALQGV